MLTPPASASVLATPHTTPGSRAGALHCGHEVTRGERLEALCPSGFLVLTDAALIEAQAVKGAEMVAFVQTVRRRRTMRDHIAVYLPRAARR